MHGCTFNRKHNDIKGRTSFSGLPGVFGALSFCLLALTVAADCRRTLRNTGMIMTLRPGQTAKSVALAGALCALLSSGAARAQGTVSVTPTVTGGGALFHYSYTVTNATAEELAIVSFPTLGNAAVTNTAAPAGFFTSYDSGNGFISFAPDQSGTGMFAAGSTVGAFTFDSPFGAVPTQFSALDVSGNEITGTTLAPAPEPSALATLTAGGLALGLCAVRARRRASVSAS